MLTFVNQLFRPEVAQAHTAQWVGGIRIGRSWGSGVVTAVAQVCNRLQPTEGEALFGGQLIKHIGLQHLRRQIDTVRHDDVLLSVMARLLEK